MRATLSIPDELVNKVQQMSGQKTKTGAIIHVMEEYVRRKKVDALLALRGRVTVEYDWQVEEEKELKAAEEREAFHAG